jgi:hypothetical protein
MILENLKTQSLFEKIQNSTRPLFYSKPSGISDKVGLALTIIAFEIILTPLASSDADPYGLKGFFDVIEKQVSLTMESFGTMDLMGDSSTTQDESRTQGRIIAQYKISFSPEIKKGNHNLIPGADSLVSSYVS